MVKDSHSHVGQGYSAQLYSWRRALAERDVQALRTEFLKIYNCEAPELFQNTVRLVYRLCKELELDGCVN